MKYEIRLSGKGGQGLVLAGIILGEAASVYENYYAIQKQSYGPEARGGASKSDVIISDEEIDYTLIDTLDVLLAMSQEAYDKYTGSVKKSGIVIVDETSVLKITPKPDVNIFSFDFTRIARDMFGAELFATIIGLGVIVGILKPISETSVKKAIENRVPQKYLAPNLNGLIKGIELSADIGHII
jgi:2-oxoglutarate ferredoxin oxidoreductase subunit gamma